MKGQTLDLFAPDAPDTRHELLAPGAWLLHGFALGVEEALIAAVRDVTASAPFRHMETPGGFRMSVAMSNCGEWGWVSDRSGYRYVRSDPSTGASWPVMPPAFVELSRAAAEAAGFAEFVPDACLINHYEPGARLTLHQDRDEHDFAAPIVSVSLGLPAVFLFGGVARTERPRRIPLVHGDVVVWGGPSRLRHHGIRQLDPGEHPLLGPRRINLTFRRATPRRATPRRATPQGGLTASRGSRST